MSEGSLEQQLAKVTAERDAYKSRLEALERAQKKPPPPATCAIHHPVKLHGGVCMVCDLEAARR